MLACRRGERGEFISLFGGWPGRLNHHCSGSRIGGRHVGHRLVRVVPHLRFGKLGAIEVEHEKPNGRYDRLLRCRCESITATKAPKFVCRLPAISFRHSQNASSRLTLVLWPATTTERLTTGDFIEAPLLVGNFREWPVTNV